MEYQFAVGKTRLDQIQDTLVIIETEHRRIVQMSEAGNFNTDPMAGPTIVGPGQDWEIRKADIEREHKELLLERAQIKKTESDDKIDRIEKELADATRERQELEEEIEGLTNG